MFLTTSLQLQMANTCIVDVNKCSQTTQDSMQEAMTQTNRFLAAKITNTDFHFPLFAFSTKK